jgi:hypothetical protein
VQRTYVSFVATEMANHLSSPAIQKVIADQARIMVTQTIGQLSGMSVSPQFQPLTIVDADTVSLAQNVQTRNDDNPPQAAPVPATPVAPTQGGSEGANPLSPVEPQQIQTTPPVKKSLPKTRKKII